MPDIIVSQKVDDFMRTTTAAQMRAVLEAVQLNGALGTPSSGVATNLTGTAAGLTAGAASAVALGGITGLGTGVAAALAQAADSASGFVTGGALAAGYLPLVGGTVTGNIIFNDTGEGVALHGGGTITGASGAITLVASGTNQNVTLTPSGTGIVSTAALVQVNRNAVTPGTLVTNNSETGLRLIGTDATDIQLSMQSYGAAGSANNVLSMASAAGTAASPTAVQSGHALGRWSSLGYDGSAYQSGSEVRLSTSEIWSGSARGSDVRFITTTITTTTRAESARLTKNFLVGGTTDITGTGGAKLFGNTAATTTTSGAFQVVGGVGIGGAAFVGGVLTVTSATASSSVSTGALVLSGASGGLGVAGAAFVGGVLNVAGVATMANSTEATNSTTAGTVITGGLAVAKKIITASSITTGAPASGTAGAWKFGIRVAATVVLDTTQYAQLDIGGTLYKMAMAV